MICRMANTIIMITQHKFAVSPCLASCPGDVAAGGRDPASKLRGSQSRGHPPQRRRVQDDLPLHRAKGIFLAQQSVSYIGTVEGTGARRVSLVYRGFACLSHVLAACLVCYRPGVRMLPSCT